MLRNEPYTPGAQVTLDVRAIERMCTLMSGCSLDLYWIPVGAGTSRLQRASLAAWEAFEALRARRPRTTLFHSALKLTLDDGTILTLEMTPAFVSAPVSPLVTGAVGVRTAGRFKLFRYQLVCVPSESLPDEQWAVGGPARISSDCEVVRSLVDLAARVPPYTWGRRVRGTPEMWTSDSAISWLLVRMGFDLTALGPPLGGRAPGWDAGQIVASRAEG